MVLSIHILKREVKNLSDKLNKYDAGKIDVTALLGFEENNIVTTIDVLSQLYLNKDKYDMTKTLNQNLYTTVDQRPINQRSALIKKHLVQICFGIFHIPFMCE